ncbi:MULTISPECIES: SDR family NAD(P)-dependent oxidoreductase [Streptomyces]|jgi:NAD(P)-dependent dehydrogenase (short-subunit alcohol dehydrogenase family)|uniref:NAD(P)-dependent dehydrogenase (Short-subunit alcohol dehydrogenase family) n=2 Tax=Streptomyces TaxID=1883 RepID=A0A514JMB1_9ACTN|nr:MULTISPECIES: SDR family oxidoreductase [Streptomyces]MBA8942277.1 NAD(P)-dependent dehydrogenase (short-subunit alcohol dehydrogenase family) [Streptomyces calvus]MBA8975787.1 NAD(P)-dependent dehydrogenase (short-subunit alcohol dehydrogenase family) [Streptomyces calvus]MYS31036.1 SDR family oxidoreductase [Streptomyces sp. SID7804]QDI68132.1 oxidoreductase [Streptomyces calvus]GGP51482.1 3-oxoacyl-ACP reductase [Streptomyces calvus]
MTTHTTEKNLLGRAALVTGGSRGIGAATALRLAREGADVAVTYVNGKEAAEEVVRAVEALGRRAVALRADAADAQEAAGAVTEAVRALGRLDILVNNAGVGLLGPVETLSPADVDRVLAVNVRGVFLTSRAAVAHLPRGGRIITVGTCMTQRVPGPGGTLYAMSKSALVGLTKALARELGERGITANIVHPGPIDTDMNPADGPYGPGQAAMTALGRFGTAEEVAATITHLAGAAYVTGAEFTVDGGHSA